MYPGSNCCNLQAQTQLPSHDFDQRNQKSREENTKCVSVAVQYGMYHLSNIIGCHAVKTLQKQGDIFKKAIGDLVANLTNNVSFLIAPSLNAYTVGILQKQMLNIENQ